MPIAQGTTTVRVQKTTREALRAEAAALGMVIDSVILAGLKALQKERLRQQFEADARRIAADPDDRAEVSAALAGLIDEG